MNDHTLMKSQRNIVLECIRQSSSLDPFNFAWSEESSRSTTENKVPVTISKLSYNNSPYYFIFDLVRGEHYCYFSPGVEKSHEQEFPRKWDNVIGYIILWLNNLEREVSQPDLWDTLLSQKLAYDQKPHPEMGNEPFTVAQADQIVDGIEKIRKYLLDEFTGNQDSTNLVNEKLDYLVNAAKRQGRTDWFHTCIGVFAGIATALAMSPDQTRSMWIILKNAISGILKLIPI